jgi:hypothetical protein
MENWCYETLSLHGETEKVLEVFHFIQDNKEPDYGLDANMFISKAFPESLCKIDNNNIFLETEGRPAFREIIELSKKFNVVGFHSGSFTEGYSEDVLYILSGQVLYSVHYALFGQELWEDTTKSKMKESGNFNYRRKLKIP